MSTRRERHPLRVGIAVWSQAFTWPELRDGAASAESSGLDSIWFGDHLLPFTGAEDQAVLEAWTILAAWAATTERIRIGLHVGANTLRNPGLVAKQAVTLDHISQGRSWLGLGGAWHEREHVAHGIEFGTGPGERLDWLEESVSLIRQLHEGATVTSPPDGHYRMVEAQQRPLPVGGPGSIPLLIGGSGEKKTLRIVARHADGWDSGADLEVAARKLDVLAGHCESAGRDMDEIELMLSAPCIVRDDPDEARAIHATAVTRTGGDVADAGGIDFFGPEERVAEAWRPFLELGFTHLISSMPAPIDGETVERLPGVRSLIDGELAS